jgi:hypothetical protein
MVSVCLHANNHTNGDEFWDLFGGVLFSACMQNIFSDHQHRSSRSGDDDDLPMFFLCLFLFFSLLSNHCLNTPQGI